MWLRGAVLRAPEAIKALAWQGSIQQIIRHVEHHLDRADLRSRGRDTRDASSQVGLLATGVYAALPAAYDQSAITEHDATTAALINVIISAVLLHSFRCAAASLPYGRLKRESHGAQTPLTHLQIAREVVVAKVHVLERRSLRPGSRHGTCE